MYSTSTSCPVFLNSNNNNNKRKKFFVGKKNRALATRLWRSGRRATSHSWSIIQPGSGAPGCVWLYSFIRLMGSRVAGKTLSALSVNLETRDGFRWTTCPATGASAVGSKATVRESGPRYQSNLLTHGQLRVYATTVRLKPSIIRDGKCRC